MTRTISILFLCLLFVVSEATNCICPDDCTCSDDCPWSDDKFCVVDRCYSEYFSQYGLNSITSYDDYLLTENELIWSDYSTANTTVCEYFTYLKWCLGNSVESHYLNVSIFSQLFNISTCASYKLIQDYRDLNYICTFGAHEFEAVYDCAKENNIAGKVNAIDIKPTDDCADVIHIANETIQNASCGSRGQAFACNFIREKINVYYKNPNCSIDLFCLDVEDYDRGYTVSHNFFLMFILILLYSVLE
ncbi:hypothetical protein FO519_006492 [Halicephalobus sp. NKZ332]|nr:hypothetical protein FO519_006492 [Halicephalobus sp. NKZ332]